jgi:hypothetical protein
MAKLSAQHEAAEERDRRYGWQIVLRPQCRHQARRFGAPLARLGLDRGYSARSMRDIEKRASSGRWEPRRWHWSPQISFRCVRVTRSGRRMTGARR